MRKKLLALILAIAMIFPSGIAITRAGDTINEKYASYTEVYRNTFNQYRYRLLDLYLDLKEHYAVTETISSEIASQIEQVAKQSLAYLPDTSQVDIDLNNKELYNAIKIATKRGEAANESPTYYKEIGDAIFDFVENVKVHEITGTIEAYPREGNAPLTTTLRSNVKDPTGTKLNRYNYTWWVYHSGKRTHVGNGTSLNYTFTKEGNYSVYLEVTSNHKNAKGNADVVPFREKVDITVNETIAMIDLRVNGDKLGNNEELKFDPDDARYGLLIDPTNSIAMGDTKFIKVEWDFGNGELKEYSGNPEIERVKYAVEGTYTVKLKLTTNTGKSVERSFKIRVHDPIASIATSKTEGYLGEKFTFNAKSTLAKDQLTYNWEIVEIETGNTIFNKTASSVNYEFQRKGRYNVKLSVLNRSGEQDFDQEVIYINSRAPVANFSSSVPEKNKPNTIYFDGTTSYDPDFIDSGRLEYSWIIDGKRTKLSNPENNGASGYYTFAEIGKQTVTLEVRDPDGITDEKTLDIQIDSILSLDFGTTPDLVGQAGVPVLFKAQSPEATMFEWNFGDGDSMVGKQDVQLHTFSTAGEYNVKLKVVDDRQNENTISKKIYISDAKTPYAYIQVRDSKGSRFAYDEAACDGKGAYIVNRVDPVQLSAEKSIDVTGEATGLGYDWKVGNSFFNGKTISKKFDELGCTPIKLTVSSQKTGKTASSEVLVQVRNTAPVLSSIDVSVENLESDPVVVNVKAVGAKDKDGVIQSYIWYYYNESDPEGEGQEYKSTKSPETTFVIPKVAGTYNFVVVMKDNNGAKTNSQKYSEEKYFITITGDNINTPIVSLSVSDSSVGVEEEVIFTASAENALGQNLNKKAKFYWDFDGDGFYDKQTSTNTTKHAYKTGGEKKVKVKVKNKGFSNTKTKIVNVANELKADFDYISIGSEFIFFDRSIGKNVEHHWDMGNDDSFVNQGSHVYSYKQPKDKFNVTLKIQDGNKTSEIKKTVHRNNRNAMAARQEKMAIFSNLDIDEDTITVPKQTDKVFLYAKTPDINVAKYVVDFDLDVDADLNGGKDDDFDNKGAPGEETGVPILVTLNNTPTQKIKISLQNKKGEVLYAKEMTISKEYIEEGITEEITFDTVPKTVKNRFIEIFERVKKFPKEHQKKGSQYLKKIQDEWNDKKERTSTILEFESYIAENNIPGKELTITLLDALLNDFGDIEGENDTLKTALQNLIPKNIECQGALADEVDQAKTTCYLLLSEKVETMISSDDKQKVKFGTQIWDTIKTSSAMTTEEKKEFGTLLGDLKAGSIGGGEEGTTDPNTLPEEKNGEKEAGSNASGLLSGAIKILLGIIVFIAVALGLFFLYFKLSKNKKSDSLSEFISEKTSVNTEKQDVLGTIESQEVVDPLADFGGAETKKEEKKESLEVNSSEVPDWMKSSSKKEEQSDPLTKETKKENVLESETVSDTPDWLKGAEKSVETKKEPVKTETQENKKDARDFTFESDASENKQKDVLEKSSDDALDTKVESGVPDWLKGSFDEDDSSAKEEEKQEQPVKKQEKSEKKERRKPVVKTRETQKNAQKESQKETDNSKDTDMFDFGKELEEAKQSDAQKEVQNKSVEPKLDTKEELDNFTKIETPADETKVASNDDSDIPDWLKGSFDEKADDNKDEQGEKKQEAEEIAKPKETQKQKEEPNGNTQSAKTTTKKKVETKQTPVKKTSEKQESKETVAPKKKTTSKKKQTKKTEKTTRSVKKSSNKTNKPQVEKKVDSKETLKNTDTKVTKQEKSTKNDDTSKESGGTMELWDDGMKIPDWLKND